MPPRRAGMNFQRRTVRCADSSRRSLPEEGLDLDLLRATVGGDEHAQEHMSESSISVPVPSRTKGRHLPELKKFIGLDDLTHWIDWVGLKDVPLLAGLAEAISVHPLHIEDLVHMDQHPKVEDTDDYTLVFLRRLYRPAKNEELQSSQVSFIITRTELVTIRESEHGLFDPVRPPSAIPAAVSATWVPIISPTACLTPSSMATSLILADLEDQIEDVQDEILANPEPELINKLHAIRSDLLIARKSLWPLRSRPRVGTLARHHP